MNGPDGFTSDMLKILFLHGWTSVPGGRKPTFLKDAGHDVLNPALPDDDFDEAVRIAQTEFDQHGPDVVVGSSRGGAVAMNINVGNTPLVLLCPAWRKWGTATTINPKSVILHSRADDVVMFADSEELVTNSGLPSESIIEIGGDHRLADPEPLRTMLMACEFASLSKNWYTIYQWGRTARVGYTEVMSSLMLAWYSQISLVESNLRQSNFRLEDHRGQAKLQTDIAQFTEKRFCRALYNRSNVSQLGKVIDYEVPLKGTQGAPHGDIDLLAEATGEVLLIEAKKPESNESILKAILEAFVYSSLVSTVRQTFLHEFSLPSNLIVVPVVLTFRVAASGRQLDNIQAFPRLRRLVRELNQSLAERAVEPLRFLFVENEQDELSTCLTTIQESNGDVKVVFRDGFVPRITEVPLSLDH
ncbi:alpha/beta fold hydrolase [Bremerella cremea]|uniref:alpha/beta fold hydrolase n=1 Tax=Bremerella cremea TaxID=1031537 RepID=UPI0018F57999|nr:alpha/beta hydrolase [Bremerella cremea]